jgi:hypothetical protein
MCLHPKITIEQSNLIINLLLIHHTISYNNINYILNSLSLIIDKHHKNSVMLLKIAELIANKMDFICENYFLLHPLDKIRGCLKKLPSATTMASSLQSLNDFIDNIVSHLERQPNKRKRSECESFFDKHSDNKVPKLDHNNPNIPKLKYRC